MISTCLPVKTTTPVYHRFFKVCPDELLIHLFRFCVGKYQDVRKLSLVCKRWELLLKDRIFPQRLNTLPLTWAYQTLGHRVWHYAASQEGQHVLWRDKRMLHRYGKVENASSSLHSLAPSQNMISTLRGVYFIAHRNELYFLPWSQTVPRKLWDLPAIPTYRSLDFDVKTQNVCIFYKLKEFARLAIVKKEGDIHDVLIGSNALHLVEMICQNGAISLLCKNKAKMKWPSLYLEYTLDKNYTCASKAFPEIDLSPTTVSMAAYKELRAMAFLGGQLSLFNRELLASQNSNSPRRTLPTLPLDWKAMPQHLRQIDLLQFMNGFLFAALNHGNIQIWSEHGTLFQTLDLSSRRFSMKALKSTQRYFSAMVLSQDSLAVAFHHQDKIEIWDIPHPLCRHKISTKSPVMQLSFYAAGKDSFLISLDKEETLNAYQEKLDLSPIPKKAKK